jgi:hypothetical protein
MFWEGFCPFFLLSNYGLTRIASGESIWGSRSKKGIVKRPYFDTLFSENNVFL